MCRVLKTEEGQGPKHGAWSRRCPKRGKDGAGKRSPAGPGEEVWGCKLSGECWFLPGPSADPVLSP